MVGVVFGQECRLKNYVLASSKLKQSQRELQGAQSQVTGGTPCVWKLIFWSFLAKTKPDQAFASHVHGKI